MSIKDVSIKGITSWTEEIPNEESLEILLDLALPHARRSGRYRHRLCDLIYRRDYAGLVAMELDPGYDEALIPLQHAYQCLAFFKKYEGLPLGIDREAVALDKFRQSEQLCKETNHIFQLRYKGEFCFPPLVESVLFCTQRKIASILGPVPSLSELDFSFGPGANTGVKASEASARFKLDARFTCSSELVGMASALLSECPAWVSAHATGETEESYLTEVEIRAGTLQFVPKNAKTFRAIVVEPLLNSFLQKGLGKHIRKRLKYSGLDLSTGQQVNQNLALRGSMTGNLATIDLSSASDTISREIVADLLPYDWLSLLSSARTGRVEYQSADGSKVRFALHKFSSMGNAFTFELESLIFWTLALSVCEVLGLPKNWTRSYGDDIIIPTEAVSLLKQVLTSVGFIMNDDKSFVNGPVRESCGKDYFLGQDIRPFFLKEKISPMRLFSLHNFYMRTLQFEFANRVRKLINPSLRIYGPDSYGDGHLIGSYHLVPIGRHRGWEGGTFDTFTLKPRRIMRLLAKGDRVLPVYTIYVNQGGEPSSPWAVRGSSGYKRISVYTHRLGIYY